MSPFQKQLFREVGYIVLWLASCGFFGVVVGDYLHSNTLFNPARTHINDRSEAWKYTIANEPTCAELRDDYRNGHTEFGGYNRGYAEALGGFSLSHGEQLCMERLTPDALKKHMNVRTLQQQAYVRQSTDPDLKFAPGPCIVSLGEETVAWEAAVVHGMLLSMFNGIPDQGFKKAFVVEKPSPSDTWFSVRGLGEKEARAFCSYVRDGYGYYKCEVSCAEQRVTQ